MISAWTIAINNVSARPAPLVTYAAGCCQYCGTMLPGNRRKYCSEVCTRRHHNIMRPTTRSERSRK